MKIKKCVCVVVVLLVAETRREATTRSTSLGKGNGTTYATTCRAGPNLSLFFWVVLGGPRRLILALPDDATASPTRSGSGQTFASLLASIQYTCLASSASLLVLILTY